MSMKEERHRHAQRYQDRIYDQMDEELGWTEEKDENKKRKILRRVNNNDNFKV